MRWQVQDMMNQYAPFNKRDLRQAAYNSRSKSARRFARVLMPVALFCLGTALWSDPVLAPKLIQGVEEIRPVLAKYAADTPLEDIVGPVPEATPADVAEATEEASLSLSSTMPASVRPVNRP
jgi:hypothetical protein